MIQVSLAEREKRDGSGGSLAKWGSALFTELCQLILLTECLEWMLPLWNVKTAELNLRDVLMIPVDGKKGAGRCKLPLQLCRCWRAY